MGLDSEDFALSRSEVLAFRCGFWLLGSLEVESSVELSSSCRGGPGFDEILVA